MERYGMHEDILEAIETTERKMLYITPDKIIIAKLESFTSYVVTQPLPLLGYVDLYAKKKERLGKLSPEAILTADKKNFAIPYSEITRLEMSMDKLTGYAFEVCDIIVPPNIQYYLIGHNLRGNLLAFKAFLPHLGYCQALRLFNLCPHFHLYFC